MDCEDLVSKNIFPYRTSSFLWSWKIAVLIAIWPLVLLHWHIVEWVHFASNILQCGVKMYRANNSHCVNIVWIEQVLVLVIIHPVISHLNLWFCLNAGPTVQQKCLFDKKNTYSKIHETHHFLFHPFLSLSLHSSKNFLNLKQNLWGKWNWTEYYTIIACILYIVYK